jgi:hypothetical protein
MKKFGTPSGAGPGVANEKVGFAAVGTPFLVFGDGGFGVFVVEVLVEGLLGPVGPLDPLLPVGPLAPLLPVGPLGPEVPLLPFDPPEPRRRDGGEELVVVPVVVGVVEVLVVGGGVDVVVVVGVLGAHEALTLLIGPTPAGTIAEAGVPVGTLTLKLCVCPVIRVTVTVH